MSITDELREWVSRELSYKTRFDELFAIADRIDAEHERKAAEVASGWDYWESTHVKVPKDADGETIHVGDVMAGEIIGGGLGEPFEVIGYIMSDGELEPMDEDKCPRKRKYLHHYHELTVEDVLRKCIGEAFDAQSMYVAESMGWEEYERELERLVEKCAEEIRGLS